MPEEAHVSQLALEVVSVFEVEEPPPDPPDDSGGFITQLALEVLSAFVQRDTPPEEPPPLADPNLFDPCILYATQVAEFDLYIAPDGTQYSLNTPGSKWVLSAEGTGMPPIEHVTQRGPFQHGETVTNYYLRPRIVQLLIRQLYGTRDAYFAGRHALLDILRPNRQVAGLAGIGAIEPGVLRKGFPDGNVLDLHVRIQQGPNFQPRRLDAWDETAFQEVLRFIAHDPIFFHPTQQSVRCSMGGEDVDAQLVFPITFPIRFDKLEGTADCTLINYTGNWPEYPTIVVQGPAQNLVIENLTTDERLQLDYTIPAGAVVTLDLTYAHKTVTMTGGVNLLGYLTPDSDLASFHLEPGINQLDISATGVNLQTYIEVRWYRRYIGY
jgi:hypothetical protein